MQPKKAFIIVIFSIFKFKIEIELKDLSLKMNV